MSFAEWNRMLQKLVNQVERAAKREQARLEVERYEQQVEELRTIHLAAGRPIDWQARLKAPAPFQPGEPGPKQKAAEAALAAYEPGWWDRMIGRAEKKRAALAAKVEQARSEDERDYRTWEASVELARRVLAGDEAAYREVLDTRDPFADLRHYGSAFEIDFGEHPKTMTVRFQVQPEKLVPTEVKTLTKTGKLSVREMPKMKGNELAQDFVCSLAIRIAREMFALLPVEQVVIHAVEDRLNQAVGRVEPVTILSVKIDREKLNALKLESIDCSEALANFEHRMRFLKTKGFQPVDPLA